MTSRKFVWDPGHWRFRAEEARTVGPRSGEDSLARAGRGSFILPPPEGVLAPRQPTIFRCAPACEHGLPFATRCAGLHQAQHAPEAPAGPWEWT
jgi:hypothetical protein